MGYLSVLLSLLVLCRRAVVLLEQAATQSMPIFRTPTGATHVLPEASSCALFCLSGFQFMLLVECVHPCSVECAAARVDKRTFAALHTTRAPSF